MNNLNLYHDIVERTNGDIYLGVVGPVRVGKSTFISKFMQSLVIPNMADENVKARTLDELPQSADGKTIMTTQPKFVPEQSATITLDNINANVRLIDCVGYLVDEALGADEDGKPRMVKTPWSSEELPLVKAAELGTQKVISDHSTIALAITTDGSFGSIAREKFIPSEEKVVAELKANNKPFVVVLNTATPSNPETITLAHDLSKKYDAVVLPINVEKLNIDNINEIFVNILSQFPLQALHINMPLWIQALPFEHPLIQEIIAEFTSKIENIDKIGEFGTQNFFIENGNFELISASNIEMGNGTITFDLKPKQSLFYSVLSDQCGMEIKDDFHLISNIKSLAKAKIEYDKIADALNQVDETGYGVVNPKFEDLELEEPSIVKQGSRYGVRIRASAPSLHIMRVDLETELTPMVGSQTQTEDFVKFLQDEYAIDPSKLWQTNMFGKTLDELISDSLKSKINGMPLDAQKKMRRTLTKIVNEGKGGIICILL